MFGLACADACADGDVSEGQGVPGAATWARARSAARCCWNMTRCPHSDVGRGGKRWSLATCSRGGGCMHVRWSLATCSRYTSRHPPHQPQETPSLRSLRALLSHCGRSTHSRTHGTDTRVLPLWVHGRRFGFEGRLKKYLVVGVGAVVAAPIQGA